MERGCGKKLEEGGPFPSVFFRKLGIINGSFIVGIFRAWGAVNFIAL